MQPRRAAKRPIDRPIASFVLCLLGGLFTVAGGLYTVVMSGSYYYGVYPYIGYVGTALGALLLLGSALIYLLPQHHVAWGIMTLVLGVSGFFASIGGFGGLFFFGPPLSLVGGSLAIGWKPMAGLGFEDYRTCLACGRHVRVEYAACPFCGTMAQKSGAGTPPVPP